MASMDLPVLPSGAGPGELPPALKPPSSLVVRYGYLRTIGEFPYDGDTRPGCGAKVVCRTVRGTELAEVLTTTCSNGGCTKSITRDKLLDYIDNSGGRDYPFSTEGRVVRIASPDDYKRASELEAEKPNYVATCKTLVRELDLPMKLVEVELLFGGEMATFYFMSDNRVDFRMLVKQLASRFRTRIQMHQVGARDEARLVADYETCGQHCCCKQFLKVLKPISMGAAKMQKATLDPNKISGRCGRLKCCLRYEEETYEDLRRKLPRLNSRVLTAEGPGTVVETMILTQLVKVRLDADRTVAVANEELLERDLKDAPRPRPASRDEDSPPHPRPHAPRPPRPAPTPDPIRPIEEELTEPVGRDESPATPDIEPQSPPVPEGATPPPDDSMPPKPGMGTLGRRRRGRGR